MYYFFNFIQKPLTELHAIFVICFRQFNNFCSSRYLTHANMQIIINLNNYGINISFSSYSILSFIFPLEVARFSKYFTKLLKDIM